jgi:DNA-damage-inducible protein J
MAKTATLTVRLDAQIKHDAQEVLKQLGMTTTQAISMYFSQISAEKALPYHPHIPNAETEAAMQELIDGKNLRTFETVEELFKALDLPDA